MQGQALWKPEAEPHPGRWAEPGGTAPGADVARQSLRRAHCHARGSARLRVRLVTPSPSVFHLPHLSVEYHQLRAARAAWHRAGARKHSKSSTVSIPAQGDWASSSQGSSQSGTQLLRLEAWVSRADRPLASEGWIRLLLPKV